MGKSKELYAVHTGVCDRCKTRYDHADDLVSIRLYSLCRSCEQHSCDVGDNDQGYEY